MTGLPFRSKLAPYEHEIVELRRQRPPVSYREIVRRLKEQYDVTVTINGVFAFLKTRKKWDRRAAAEKKPAVASAPSSPSQSTRPSAMTAGPADTGSSTDRRQRFHFTFSNRYNLTRLSPEEKDSLEKKLNDPLKGQS